MKRTHMVLGLALSVVGCDASRSVVPNKANPPDATSSIAQGGWVQEIVTDYAGPADTHAGPGPHPTTETNRYSLLSGGIQWATGGTIEYRIVGTEPVSGANAATVAGEQTWDALVSRREFARNDATTQLNPCTGVPSAVTWAFIDGPGGVLGSAAPCYYLNTKEIVGFSIRLDSGDSWGTSGSATVFDAGDVSTHEFGHVFGLGHVNAPRDGCLTMYRFVIEGEIQKRTLGLGDKLGLAALYGNTNTSAGACGA